MGKEEGHPLRRLADLIGLVARSHGTSLRVCKAYLDSSPLYPGTPRPMGTAVLYPMALLRVADYFAAELTMKRVEAPESPLAKIWQETLGARPIPFDPGARQALIEHGMKHPELRRHIEAWQEMKRTGSKWATGEWDDRQHR